MQFTNLRVTYLVVKILRNKICFFATYLKFFLTTHIFQFNFNFNFKKISDFVFETNIFGNSLNIKIQRTYLLQYDRQKIKCLFLITIN